MKAVCVMAAYNEEKRITPVIRGAMKFVSKVIVVDDGSTDKTSEVSKKAGAVAIRYDANRGKGYAIRIGLRKAVSLRPDVIVLLDADGQHNPEYIPDFVDAISGGADYAYGRRDLSKYPFNRKIGNLSLTFLTNLLCPTGIMDTESGYRAMTLEATRKMDIRADRYGVEMDFAYCVWKNKFRVKQIKIDVPVFHSKAAIRRGLVNFCYLLRRRFDI